jgi:hypothetical protein
LAATTTPLQQPHVHHSLTTESDHPQITAVSTGIRILLVE